MEFNELFDQSPVDWVKIKKRLLKNGHTMQTIYAAFKPTEGGGRIVVNVVDERLAKDLLRTITKIRSGDSRIEATKKGNSHRAKTSGGIFITASALSAVSVTTTEDLFPNIGRIASVWS